MRRRACRKQVTIQRLTTFARHLQVNGTEGLRMKTHFKWQYAEEDDE